MSSELQLFWDSDKTHKIRNFFYKDNTRRIYLASSNSARILKIINNNTNVQIGTNILIFANSTFFQLDNTYFNEYTALRFNIYIGSTLTETRVYSMIPVDPHKRDINDNIFTNGIEAHGGTFTDEIIGTNGNFSGNISGVNGTFSGNISGVDGTFSGNMSGANGNFTGNITSMGAGSFANGISTPGEISTYSLSGYNKISGDLYQGNISIYDAIYPVGSLYMSTESQSPASIFGGTWAQLKGETIVAVDPDDTDFEIAGLRGGSKTVTLTVDQMPSHNHSYTRPSSTTYMVPQGSFYGLRSQDTGQSTGNKGGGQAHDNMPPYYTCYVWRRTA